MQHHHRRHQYLHVRDTLSDPLQLREASHQTVSGIYLFCIFMQSQEAEGESPDYAHGY